VVILKDSEKSKETEELDKAIEQVTEIKNKVDNHPLVKKYGLLTGLFIGFIVIVMFFNNSMIGVGSVETKDSQINHLDGIGGSVETKSNDGNMNTGIGADKTNSKDSSVSKEDSFAMSGKITSQVSNFSGSFQDVHVYNTTLSGSQVQALYHQDESSGSKYPPRYDASDISGTVIGVFGSAVTETTSWVSMLVLLAVVGVILAIVMGVLFKVSRILGLG
jgi:hypothetical protein